ncbi:hypothetical protein Ndes2526A_g01053 [Nannochloris sp. 'desiccata']|nr:hypothetical protein KSW81_002113 [Chlorella desiccata (nom. nud.)]
MSEISDPIKIAALRPDTSGHTLVVKVVEVKPVIERAAKQGGKTQKIAECVLGDETGTVIFSARNEQVVLMKSGSYLTLTNAKVEMFRGNMRLVVPQGNSGKIEEAEMASFEPKIDNNMSMIEYELVPLLPEGGGAAKSGKEDAKIEVEES